LRTTVTIRFCAVFNLYNVSLTRFLRNRLRQSRSDFVSIYFVVVVVVEKTAKTIEIQRRAVSVFRVRTAAVVCKGPYVFPVKHLPPVRRRNSVRYGPRTRTENAGATGRLVARGGTRNTRFSYCFYTQAATWDTIGSAARTRGRLFHYCCYYCRRIQRHEYYRLARALIRLHRRFCNAAVGFPAGSFATGPSCRHFGNGDAKFASLIQRIHSTRLTARLNVTRVFKNDGPVTVKVRFRNETKLRIVKSHVDGRNAWSATPSKSTRGFIYVINSSHQTVDV